MSKKQCGSRDSLWPKLDDFLDEVTKEKLQEEKWINRGYLPIEDYGIIGNLYTSALISVDGSIDFMCWPEFDSPSVFCRLLDKNKGGHFIITPNKPMMSKQQYLPWSNILTTRFLSKKGVGVVTDFMHRPDPNTRPRKPIIPWLIRQVEVTTGAMEFDIECFPAFDYARSKHTIDIENTSGIAREKVELKPIGERVFGSSGTFDDGSIEGESYVGKKRVVFESLVAGKTVKMDLRHIVCTQDDDDYPEVNWLITKRESMEDFGVTCRVSLKEGQSIVFIMREVPGESNFEHTVVQKSMSQQCPKVDTSQDPPLSWHLFEQLLDDTWLYWYRWLNKSTYAGRWREHVERSALTLKLLTFEPTGAVVAAPTFSLPEHIGGSRNWDYRYVWIRDSAFTMYALMRLGLTSEAKAYMSFMNMLCRNKDEKGGLRIMYSIRGSYDIEEVILPHLEGYMKSAPVRIGNGAMDHLQLDIYGELLDATYLYNRLGTPISYDTWLQLRDLVDYVCNNYDQPDMGIWEVRGQKKNFTYSKLQCWVAIDRGLRFVMKRGFPCPQKAVWEATRDKLYKEIMERSWNSEKQIFAQSYEDNSTLDAATLAMPMVLFLDGSDPRFRKTLSQIMKPLEKGGLVRNNLVYRYNTNEHDDGVGGDEGSFSLCTFWMVEALTRCGQHNPQMLHKASHVFQQMLDYSNHVGLFSEEISASGKMLGNFPQAFTHIALISAAFNLDKVLGKYKP